MLSKKDPFSGIDAWPDGGRWGSVQRQGREGSCEAYQEALAGVRRIGNDGRCGWPWVGWLSPLVSASWLSVPDYLNNLRC